MDTATRTCRRAAVILMLLAPGTPVAHAGSWVGSNSGLKNLTVIGIGIAPSNPNVIYIQARSLGIYKSTDGGATWVKKSGGIPDADPGLGHLLNRGPAVHPSDPNTAWAVSSGYVYKTVNGGTSWTQSSTGTTVNGVSAVRGVVVDPSDPAHLFAGTIVSGADGGVFESTNGGVNWSNIAGSAVLGSGIGNDAWPIVVDPANPLKLYSGSPHESVWRSIDGGHVWISAAPVGGDASCYEVELNPAASNQVWAGASNATWLSNNSAVAWTHRGDFNDKATTMMQFAASNPQVAYAIAGSTVWRSDNSGASWTAKASISGGPRCLAVHPSDPNTLYVGTWGLGMFKSSDGGQSFSEANTGLPLTTMIQGQQAFAVNGVLYCILTGSVMYRLDPGQTTWQYHSIAPGNYVIVDPHQPTRWFCASGGLWRSTDLGLTWQASYSPADTVSVFGCWADPVTCNRVVVGDTDITTGMPSVSESLDAGDTWTLKGTLPIAPPPKGATYLSDVSGDPYDPNVLLVAAYPAYTSNRQNGYVWRSANGGANWSQIRDGMFYGDWRVGDGEWQISGTYPNTLYQRVRVYCNYRVNLDHHTFGDGTYECRMRIVSADAPASWAGMVIRLSSADSNYGASGWLLYMRQNGDVNLFNPIDHEVITVATGINPSNWVTLKLAAAGNAFEIFLNGASIGTYTDAQHRFDGAGYVGFVTCQAETLFDDLSIQAGATYTDTFSMPAKYGASYGRWLASDPHNAGVFALSTQGGGVWRSSDHGTNWQWVTGSAGEGLVNYRPMISSLLDGNIYLCRGSGYSWGIDNIYSAGTAIQRLGQTLTYSALNVSEDPIDPNKLYTTGYTQGVLIYQGDDVAGMPAVPFDSRGDFDHDGDVDQADFAHFQTCLSGRGVEQNDPACLDARLDADTDVDADDLDALLPCVSGANLPPDPGCRCGNP